MPENQQRSLYIDKRTWDLMPELAIALGLGPRGRSALVRMLVLQEAKRQAKEERRHHPANLRRGDSHGEADDP